MLVSHYLLGIERYCSDVLNNAATVTISTMGTAHERYRELYQLMEKRDNEIVHSFDPHTRPRAEAQLIGFFQMRLISDDELAVFSDDLQRVVRSYIEQ